MQIERQECEQCGWDGCDECGEWKTREESLGDESSGGGGQNDE